MGIGIKKRIVFFIILSVCLLFGLSGNKGYAAEAGYREFLNDRNRPQGDYSGDGREVFRIVEVIPHDVCSIFPYMIDWKTEEEYNRNIPIGYDGLVFGSVNTGNVQIFETEDSTEKKPFSQIKRALKRDYLPSYNIVLASWSSAQRSSNWWRYDDLEDKYLENGLDSIGLKDAARCENGYFEYTGENKGLYYINTKIVKGEGADKAANGICYEMQALPRDSAEKGTGEYEVKDGKYYWAKDYDGDLAPSTDIQSKTKFNYDLIFHEFTGNNKDAYKVHKVEKKPGDYYVKLKEGLGLEKTYQFEEYEGGNYKKMDNGFEYKGIGEGNYIVKMDLITNTNLNKVIFEYAGIGQGVFDVSFIYAGVGDKENVLYEATVNKVTNGNGRYALTSTSLDSSAEESSTPVYIESTNGDYGKVITQIDFAGIDFKESGYGGNYAEGPSNGAGARLGRDQRHDNEYGSWIFREMDYIPKTEYKYTKLADVTDKNSFQVGDKIYVNQQNRIYRYYCRHGFQNNEWFKLLCYFNNPGGPKDENAIPYSNNDNGQGYDQSISSSKNLVKAKDLLDEFNHNNRIEVIQRTPGALTKEEVESADLIYIADSIGIESLNGFLDGSEVVWNAISNLLIADGQLGLKPLPSTPYKFNDDLGNDVLLALYDRCIYKRECALMVSPELRHSYMDGDMNGATKNLGKLIFFMDLMRDARHFAYFIDGYNENCDIFNMIHNYSGIEVLGIETWPKQQATATDGSPKEMYNFKREGDSQTDSHWTIYHFEVPQELPLLHETISWKGSGYTGESSIGKVLDGETKYYSGWNNPSNFSLLATFNIWTILHNRKSTGKLIVEITNAKLTNGEDKIRVIYADEFDPDSFLVKYKILLKGASSGDVPELNDTIIYFDDNNNGICDAGEQYEIKLQQKYDTEDGLHQTNVKKGFEDAGSSSDPKLLDPNIIMRKVVVEASNTDGVSASADVWIVVREGFNLN